MDRTIEQLECENEWNHELEPSSFGCWHLIPSLLPGHRINDTRLGMAMKEVFRRWDRIGRDPFGDKRHRFVNEVFDTYFLFTEISQRLQGIVKGCQESEVPDAGATSLGFAGVGAGSLEGSGCWVEV